MACFAKVKLASPVNTADENDQYPSYVDIFITRPLSNWNSWKYFLSHALSLLKHQVVVHSAACVSQFESMLNVILNSYLKQLFLTLFGFLGIHSSYLYFMS